MKTKQKIFKKILLGIMLAYTLLLPLSAMAADTSKTSFTEFKGGLEAPSTQGYAAGLVQATDARSFILNVTNFFLGFLGLVAVVIIIYGGFMYVIDMGKGESGGKGKKAITYAVIGLIIVMASYAIVNTILQAPGGTTQKGSAGTTTASLNFSRLASQVKSMAKDIENAYNWAYTSEQDLVTAMNTLASGVTAVRKCVGAMSGSKDVFHVCEYTDPNTMISSFQQNMDQVGFLMNRIMLTVPTFESDIELSDTTMETTIKSFIVSLKNKTGTAITAARNEIAKAQKKASDDEANCRAAGLGTVGAVSAVGGAITNVGSSFIGQGADSSGDFCNKNPNYSEVASKMLDSFDAQDDSIADGTDLTKDPYTRAQSELGKRMSASRIKIHNRFNEVVVACQKYIKEIYLLVGPVTNIANEPFKNLLSQAMMDMPYSSAVAGSDTKTWDDNDLNSYLKTLRNDVVNTDLSSFEGEGNIPAAIAKMASPKTAEAFSTAISEMSKLYDILSKIKFVYAKLVPSVIEGNAPLTVDFSSIGSQNPNGISIVDDLIHWDLNGNSTGEKLTGYDESLSKSNGFMNCNEEKKPTISCTYLRPGTYKVKLKIEAGKDGEKDPVTNIDYNKEIAAGIATVIIKVKPPQTKINLKIGVAGGSMTDVIAYDNYGFLKMSKDTVSFLSSEAKAGIDFDATLTKSVNGTNISNQASEGAQVKWDFGDSSVDKTAKSTLIASQYETATDANLKKTHSYQSDGIYEVKLEFIDKNKVVDRKIFNVVVGPVAAQIDLEDRLYGVGDKVTLDGGNSRSDNGQISQFSWSCSEGCPKETVDPSAKKAAEKIYYTFSKPAENGYTVTLNVTDSQGANGLASATVNITSKPPVAKFKATFPNPNQPAMLVLDASTSYDSDGTKGEAVNYNWQINGQDPATAPGVESFTLKQATVWNTFLRPNDTTSSPYAVVKFNQKGTYNISLQVTDVNDPNNPSEIAQKDIVIDNILGIAWGEKDKFTASLAQDKTTGQFVGTINITVNSDGATSYEVDYGDGSSRDKGDFSKTIALKHSYKDAGVYLVTARVYDSDNNENTLTRKAYVNSSDAPIPVISLKVNDGEVFPDESGAITVNRKDTVTFDGSKSLNTDGTGRRLNYSWSINGVPVSTKREFSQSFKDLNEKGNKVELKVTNADNVSQITKYPDSVLVIVKGEAPSLSSMVATASGSNLTTPVTVNVSAIDPVDADGRIVSYRWWYYDPNNDTNQMGVQVSTSPAATITVGTRGNEGEQKTYKFAMEMTDNENNKVSVQECSTSTDPNVECLDSLPSITVTNGPNKAPVAKFNVDRTSIKVGESVEFTSSSTDPDGKIIAYYWDFEGDGFANNTQDEGPNVTHTFNQSAKNGIPVRLKVEDNNGSEETSDPVLIYVEGKAGAPVAAFTSMQQDATSKVDFKDNSTADIANGVTIDSWTWDFDLSFDSNGDGKNDNDTDSAQQNPTFNYADFTKIKNDYKVFGIKRAKLTVKDSEGNTSSVSNFVNVKAPVTATSTQQVKPSTQVVITQQVEPPKTTQEVQPALDARLLTDPVPNVKDGKIHLQGDSGMITLDYSTSIGNIVKYVIDKNINFDSNGNGNPADDEDKVDTKPGKWTTDFQKSWGNITIRLTVTDSKGKKDSVDKIVVFDSKTSSSSLISVLHTESNDIVALLVSIMGFAILGMLVSKISKSNQK